MNFFLPKLTLFLLETMGWNIAHLSCSHQMAVFPLSWPRDPIPLPLVSVPKHPVPGVGSPCRQSWCPHVHYWDVGRTIPLSLSRNLCPCRHRAYSELAQGKQLSLFLNGQAVVTDSFGLWALWLIDAAHSILGLQWTFISLFLI